MVGKIHPDTEAADINRAALTIHPGMVLHGLSKKPGQRPSLTKGMEYHVVLDTIRNYGRPLLMHFAETVVDIQDVQRSDFTFNQEGKLGIQWRHNHGARPVVAAVAAHSFAAKHAPPVVPGMQLDAVGFKGRAKEVEQMTFADTMARPAAIPRLALRGEHS